jgi:predicted amidophosphoribosyltransferase
MSFDKDDQLERDGQYRLTWKWWACIQCRELPTRTRSGICEECRRWANEPCGACGQLVPHRPSEEALCRLIPPPGTPPAGGPGVIR